MKRKKLKTVAYELIGDGTPDGIPMYGMLRRYVRDHHPDLADARIVLAWCLSWKPDVDGRVVLGKCKKASDLDRELAAFDFIVLLRRAFWRHPSVTDAQREALLDHELCHAAAKFDATGEPVVDERGRRVWRTRKHDLEEFTAVVERHGMWHAELETFASALKRGAATPVPFEPCDVCRESPGWAPVVGEDGRPRVTRCQCWRRYQEAQEDRRELAAS